MRFADIPFHDDIKARLRMMVDSDKLPHALLLEGPSGAGKFALARATAQYLHCEHRSGGEPCGVCPACLQHQSFNHIDTIFSFPVVKKKNDSRAPVSSDYIDVFCDFLAETPMMDFDRWLVKLDNVNAQPVMYVDEGAELLRRLSFTAHGARYKVVLMWLPERMQEPTANKLLKLIEEPSDDTRFILVSNNPRAILPTIYSRTQRVEVRRYDDAEVVAWLMGEKGLSADDAAEIARLSEGNLNKAASLLGTSSRSHDRLEQFITLMRLAYQRKIVELRGWGDSLAAEGRETLLSFFEYATGMLRENYVYALRVGDLNRMTPEEEAFSRNFSPFVNERNVEQLMTVFDTARADIDGNTNPRIVCFDVALKVILLLKR